MNRRYTFREPHCTVRIGILGAGGISDTHARAAQAIDGVEVVAVHGTNRDKAAALARADRRGRVHDDLEAFLAHPMDIVAIGSPSGVHAEQAIAAVRRGLHVLVEKPLDITTARIDDVIDEADRAGVKVGVFFQDRLTPDLVEMKTAIDAGALGTPVLASGRVKWYRPPEYYRDSRWRGTRRLDGGGVLMNQAIHTSTRCSGCAVPWRACRAASPRGSTRSTSKTRRPRCSSSRAAPSACSKRPPPRFPGSRAASR